MELAIAVAAEVHRVEGALHDPRVALLEPFDTRCSIAVLLGKSGRPEVGRLVDVRVGRDQFVVTHESYSRFDVGALDNCLHVYRFGRGPRLW